jgi:hypothetical protein
MKNSLVGFAVAASLLVGCQTAQKSNFTGELTAANFEGLDVANYGADRKPAGVTDPIVKGVMKISHSIQKKVFGGAKSHADDLLRFINESKDESVIAIRDAKGASNKGKKALTVDDVDGLPTDVQAKLVAQWMESRKIKDLPNLSAETRGSIDAARSTISKTDTLAGSKGSSKKLLSEMNETGVKVDQRMSAASKESSRSGFEILSTSIEQMKKTDPRFNTAEGKELTDAIMEESLVIFTYSRTSHFIPETCDNLDFDSAKKYLEALRETRKDLEEFAPVKYVRGQKKAIRGISCKNVDDIATYSIEKFQNSLMRFGQAATTARREMGACRYIASSVANNPNTFATGKDGAVGPKPTCK